ncbi:MAG: hypothetical protein CSA34_00835 [Desulfobulbus propionicus]|nr:MAG: hypothetical protein CSA34_00835 [Desulfobulbus propionicus]
MVTHELCHLISHDHGPEFYRLLDSVIPGWEKINAARPPANFPLHTAWQMLYCSCPVQGYRRLACKN